MGLSSCTGLCLTIECKDPWSHGGRRKSGLGLCKKVTSSGAMPSKQPGDSGCRGGERQPELREKAKGQRPAEGGNGNSTEDQQLKALFRACAKEQPQAQAHSPPALWKRDLTLIGCLAR